MKCLPGGGMQTVFKKPTLLLGLKSAAPQFGPRRAAPQRVCEKSVCGECVRRVCVENVCGEQSVW